MPEIEAIHLKLDRAREHFDAFNAERLAWIRSYSPRLDRRWTNEYTEQFSIHGVEDPPLRLGVLIGDSAHNLRSALDHLVFSLWTAESGSALESTIRGVQMPIEASRDRFDEVSGRMIGGLSAGAAQAVEGLQPYHRPPSGLPAYPGQPSGAWEPIRHPLWLLKEISNVDKHRVLPLIAIQPIGHMFDPPIPPGLGHVVSASTGPMLEGQTVLDFAYSTPRPADLINPALHWDVGFAEPTGVGLSYRPPYPVKLHLEDIIAFVRHTALPQLADHLPP